MCQNLPEQAELPSFLAQFSKKALSGKNKTKNRCFHRDPLYCPTSPTKRPNNTGYRQETTAKLRAYKLNVISIGTATTCTHTAPTAPHISPHIHSTSSLIRICIVRVRVIVRVLHTSLVSHHQFAQT